MKNHHNYPKSTLRSNKLFFAFNEFKITTQNSINIFVIMLFLGGIAQSFSQTRPTELYVDASYTGTTASDGSEAFPYTTIYDALQRRVTLGTAGMVSDEKIIVKAGTYKPYYIDDNDHTMIFINVYNSGEEGYWFALEAEGDVIIDGADLYGRKFASLIAVTSGALSVRVKGFKHKNQRNNQSLAEIIDGVLVKDTKFGIQIRP
tara:strand:+ start:54 stop:665 length:612 start_codon:yes stop_codon:yes gene_type:complete